MLTSINGFHIEVTNICTLKCSGCARTRFIEQWPSRWKNHSLDPNALWNFLDIDLRGKLFILCGNYGDPIYHPDLGLLIAGIKDRGGRISIITNGSYRSTSWWADIVGYLDRDDSVTFSIDGLPENFQIYRQNANWQSIRDAIDICVTSNARVIWKYIPFSYNYKDIDSAQSLSQDLGIDEFVLEPSDRFDEKTQHLMPSNEFLGARFDRQQDFKKGIQSIVKAKCQNGKEHFITATGHYTPCCYLADHRFYYKNLFGQDRDFFDIRTTTISKLLNQARVIEFYSQIPTNPIAGCRYNCPG